MPGFSTRDDLISEAALGKTERIHFSKVAASAGAAGLWHTLWKGTGSPAAGADPATTPGTAYDVDQATFVTGAVGFPDRSTDQKYLLKFGGISNAACVLMLYDRLVGVSGVALSTTGNKTINSAALTRYTGTAANLNEVWLEITTATTVTAPVVSLNSYTTADGTAATAGGTVTFPAAATTLNTMIQVPLNDSKSGVRSVEVGLNVGTAGSAGVATLVIIRPLARILMTANVWNEVNFLDDYLDLPRIFDNAALGLAMLNTGGNQPTLQGVIETVYG